MSTTFLMSISLGLSTLLCFFTNSWLTIWVLLEINTLSFCALTISKSEVSPSHLKESLMKYLVVQSMASAILIIVGITKETGKSCYTILLLIMLLALLVKMAAAPFHYWFIQISKKMNWLNNKILFTWQKMIPIYLIIYQMKKMLLPFVAASVLWGSIFLINKKTFKEILALSSIFNLGWMLLAISLNTKILLIFSAIYWTSLIFFIEEISKKKAVSFNEKNSKFNKMSFFLKTINLAGIPPLMLFTAKWMTFSSMLMNKLSLLASFILVVSSINIFVYLRMTMTHMVQNSMKEQKPKAWNTSYKEILFLSVNLLTLILLVS